MQAEISIKDQHSEVIAKVQAGEDTEEVVRYFYHLMLAKGHHGVKNYITLEDD